MHHAFGSPDPVSAGFEVILSVDDEPVSLTKLSVTAGGVWSSWNASALEGPLVLVAASVAVAVKL
jgi:hypothetical protein